MEGVTVVDHPLVQHKLTLIREKERSTKSFRELLQRDRHAALLRGHARSAARMGGDRDADDAHEGAEDRRQEAGVRADPARRAGARRGHARPRADGARRPYRALSRSGDAGRGRILSSRRRPTSPSAWSSSSSPVLATANTAVAAIDRLKERGAKDIRVVCLIAVAGGRRAAARHSSRRQALDRRDRRSSGRRRLHHAGPRRRRRPRLRHGIAARGQMIRQAVLVRRFERKGARAAERLKHREKA